MKQLKAGQIYHPKNLSFNVRVKKRTDGCKGCILDNPCICPDVVVKGEHTERPHCMLQGIIFVKP